MREQVTESRDGVMTRSHRRENRSLDQRMDPEDRHFAPRTGGFSDVSRGIRDLSCIVRPLAASPNQPAALREREITVQYDSATTGTVPPDDSIGARQPRTRRHKSAFPRRLRARAVPEDKSFENKGHRESPLHSQPRVRRWLAAILLAAP